MPDLAVNYVEYTPIEISTPFPPEPSIYYIPAQDTFKTQEIEKYRLQTLKRIFPAKLVG